MPGKSQGFTFIPHKSHTVGVRKPILQMGQLKLREGTRLNKTTEGLCLLLLPWDFEAKTKPDAPPISCPLDLSDFQAQMIPIQGGSSAPKRSRPHPTCLQSSHLHSPQWAPPGLLTRLFLIFPE